MNPRLSDVTLFLVGITSPLPRAPACFLKEEVIR